MRPRKSKQIINIYIFGENTPSANQIKFLKEVISPEQSDSEEDTSVTTYTQGGASSSSLSSRETENTNKPDVKTPEPSKNQDISSSQAVNFNWTNEIVHENSPVERLKRTEDMLGVRLFPGRKDSGYVEDIFEFNPLSDLTALRVPILPMETSEFENRKTEIFFVDKFLLNVTQYFQSLINSKFPATSSFSN